MVKFNSIEALDSKVMWVDDFIAGVKFNHPVHPAVFDLLLSRLSTRGLSIPWSLPAILV